MNFQDLGLPSDETIAGIVFEMGKLLDGTTADAGFSVIRDLSILGKGGAAAPSNLPPPDDSQTDFPDGTSRSGIELHAQALIENCFIAGFQHDGIHINTSVRGNADVWQVRNCLIESNHRHGMFVTGGDSGVGCAIGVNCGNNDKFGVYDQAFVGNVYLACHVEANHEGGYKIGNGAARTAALCCESEDTNFITYPAISIGGTFVKGWNANGYAAPVILYSEGTFNAVSVRATAIREINNSTGPEQRIITTSDSVILANAQTGPLDLTLPNFDHSDISLSGFTVTVKKTDNNKSNPVSIVLPAVQQGSIDGQTQIPPLTEPLSWVTLLYGGLSGASDWYVIGKGTREELPPT